ncbi:MAG: RNA polymerase sigma factor [Gemmatimonadota bacterium]|nr:RNA polymerase sigma factor [Gemmatimonadota bacterium]
MSERELIERARAGKADAERALYEAHVDPVFRLAYRMCGNDELARDFTQEAFIKAFDGLEDFRGDAAFGTWIHTITTRVVLNGLRKVKRRNEHEAPMEAAANRGAGPRRTEPDVRDRLREALDELSDGYRMVVVMHDLEGYTHKEIGDALGIATGSSKARLSRARAQLRESLSDYAVEWMA